MKGVTILDRDRGRLAFDLRDILVVLGEEAERSMWTLRSLECAGGDAATALHRASDTAELLPGDQLVRLAADVGQVIDGELSGCIPGAREPWIIIRAIDSSAFDVETDRDDVLTALRTRFESVRDLPSR